MPEEAKGSPSPRTMAGLNVPSSPGSDEVIIHSVKGRKKGLNYLNLKMLSMNKSAYFTWLVCEPVQREMIRSACVASV